MHDTRPSNHTDPLLVAELWAQRLGEGSLDELMSLYSRSAPLHTAGEVVTGQEAIREFWEGSPLLRGPRPQRVVRANGMSVVRWDDAAAGTPTTTSELLIRNGRIVEQWIGEALLTESVLGSIPVEFSHAGAISAGDRAAVVNALERALDGVNEHVTHVRVRMEHSQDRNRERPTSLRAVIDLRGGAVRADVRADTTRSAIDAIEVKLRSQLRDRAERRAALQHRGVNDGSWRHGDPATERPDYFPRPVEERQVVRLKSVAPVGSDVEEAIFDLTSMDYDFYLFTESATRCDALVFHDDDRHGVVVEFAGATTGTSVRLPDGVRVVETPTPTLTLGAARERLDAGHEPRVFFIDADAGRAHVLYRRYDGHYGLIVPIDEQD